ncbi:TetR/AcrR family transcriptional regulator [Rhodobacter sp. KR11]|uniref:TetR/AcrR family transcriptional regulator n=1 Tax=Rhodobacter sp. KR11 TaxID=2974588 RepID=UPI0022231327|nr:TetR/AcrR family transcriptional regulator [Rhodobacter sp. KR11]MCW1918002.1 TetR/AcrR family transcriptional regulator [Rhodobacter sp. KR11]
MNLTAPPCPEATAVIHPRQAEILRAVRQAFVEKGFDGASMQDLARAAGMSVGNFYRYFPSKAAIIGAMVLMDAQEIRADFAAILAAPSPLTALRHGLRERIFGADCAKDSALWAEIDAAARRMPEVAEAHRMIESEVRGQLIAVFAAGTGLPLAEANRRFSTHAAFLLTLFKAAACADAMLGVDIPALRAMIAETLDARLDEILRHATPPPD